MAAAPSRPVLMCTGIKEESRQNELFLLTKALGGDFIRDKVAASYQLHTTHLVVAALAKTEKLLCGLAAGVPLVDPSFIRESSNQKRWIDNLDQFDIGSPSHPLRQENRLFIPTLSAREKVKKEGGMFRNWRAVVVMEDVKLQEIYRKILELGGAKVEKWTSKHLSDLNPSQMKAITHVISHPNMLMNEDFQSFVAKNDQNDPHSRIPTLAFIYVGDYLVKETIPPMEPYDLRQTAMVDMLADEENKEYLRTHYSSLQVLAQKSHPELPGPMMQMSQHDPVRDLNVDDGDNDEADETMMICDGQSSDLVSPPRLRKSPRLSRRNSNNSETMSAKRSASKELFSEAGKRQKMVANLSKNVEEITIEDLEEEDDSKKARLKMLAQRFMNKNINSPSSSGIRKDSAISISSDSSAGVTPDKKAWISISSESPGTPRSSRVRNTNSSIYMSCQSSASSQQAKIDSWVSRTPKTIPNKITVEEEVIVLNDTIDATPSRPQSSLTLRRRNTPVNSQEESPFLAKTRSGSIRRSSSVRSQLYFSSQNSCEFPQSSQSQDSFVSEAGSDVSQVQSFDINKVAKDPLKQQMWLINLMMAQRRLTTHRLDVGSGGVPLTYPQSSRVPEQISPSFCQSIWLCLDSDADQTDLHRNIDLGWINAASLLTQVVNEDTYAPSAALHKVMVDAVRDHPDAMVRQTALNSLLHCVSLHQPGPGDEAALIVRDIYLEVFSKETPHVGKWEFNPEEAFIFLDNVIETCIGRSSKDNSDTSGSSSGADNSSNDSKNDGDSHGYSLVLKLFTVICELDLNNYFDHIKEEDRLDVSYKPFLACVLCPRSNIAWSKSYQRLLKLYSKALSFKAPEEDMVNIRKLVGLAAQILQFKDRTAASQQNSLKLELARDLAFQLAAVSLPDTRLWCELYLLEPGWLAALVSRAMLEISTNTAAADTAVSLRSTLATFVDAELSVASSCSRDGGTSGPAVTSTPLNKKSINNNVPATATMSPVKSPMKAAARNSKINVNKQNKYGETPLHTAAKKGNVAKLQECLSTPGVDINCRDHLGYTPLSEAVAKGHGHIVELLLNHTPKTLPIHSFFTPTKTQDAAQRKKFRVDILQQNSDEKDLKNPFQEAVDNDDVTIARLILDTLAREEARPEPGLPSVAAVLASSTGRGETTLSLARSQEMRTLLASYSRTNTEVKPEDKENALVPISDQTKINIKDVSTFKVLLEINIVKYLSANCLSHICNMFKKTKPEDLLSAIAEDFEPSEAEDHKFGKVEFVDGFKPTLFGKKDERFEINREKAVMVQDVRTYDKIIRFEKDMKQVNEEHPIFHLFKAMKITKICD